ncbi:MAG: hypothetical protein HY903_03410 [Deltaproteobacteria bacterium]|nr:hypothetical protein [Deltaproteobacteria bacterium]
MDETEAYRRLHDECDCDSTWMHEPRFREIIDLARTTLDRPVTENTWLNDGQHSNWPTAEVLHRARAVSATALLLARRQIRLNIEETQGHLLCRVTGTGALSILDVATGTMLATEAITAQRIEQAGGESDAYAVTAASLLRSVYGEDVNGRTPACANVPAATPTPERKLRPLGQASISSATPMSDIASNPSRPCPERVLESDYAVTDAASLRRLVGVTWLKGGLTIRGPFVDLRGLECLARVEGMLDIRGNEFLASLKGLDGLTEIHSSLVVGQNPSLTSLAGLHNLARVVAVQLIGNDRLASLTGLDSLAACNVYIIVQDHTALVSLDGLGNLRSPGDSLYFLDNRALSTCLIEDLVQRLRRAQWTGQTRIEGNLEGGLCAPPDRGAPFP